MEYAFYVHMCILCKTFYINFVHDDMLALTTCRAYRIHYEYNLTVLFLSLSTWSIKRASYERTYEYKHKIHLLSLNADNRAAFF